MDWLSALKDMIVSGEGLLLLAAVYGLWWLSGKIPNLFSEKRWDWKRGLEDLCKLLLMGAVLVGGIGIGNIGAQFFAMLGWDIREAVSTFSSYALMGSMSTGFAYYYSMAMKNAWKFFRLKKAQKEGDQEQFEKGKEEIATGTIEAAKTVAENVVTALKENKNLAKKHETYEQKGGRGALYVVPVQNYDAFRGGVLGKGYDIDGAYGYQCLTAGHLVLMDDGSYKAIEEIEEGEQIAGGKTVISNAARMAEVMKVRTQLGWFSCTLDHKCVLEDGTIKLAKELERGDEIALNLSCPEEPKFNLTYDELEFLGFWLGDGTKKYRWENSTSPEIFVTVGTGLKEEYLENLNVGLTKRLHSNGRAHVYRLVNRQHPVLAELIHMLAGKELPRVFTAEQYKYIVEGYSRADGSARGQGWVATSTDKSLLLGIQFGCLVNGVRAILSQPTHREATNYCEHPKDIWHLTINPKVEVSNHVISTEIQEEEEEVYVLNLDGDHIYTADNMKHHNCWDGTALLWQQIGRSLMTGNGCASGCWTLKRDINAGKDFTLITKLADVKRGDVMVFSTGTYGHIGFADENYNGSGCIRLLGQNQGGTPKSAKGGAGFNVITMSTQTFLGAFRFNNWKVQNASANTPTTPQKANEVIADEVIAGKWGNNPERAQKLKAAGYDAEAIQAVVNARLAPKTQPQPAPAKSNFAVGDTVIPTKTVDYTGHSLRQYDPKYVITALSGDRAVLSARGSVWAAMSVNNLRKA